MNLSTTLRRTARRVLRRQSSSEYLEQHRHAEAATWVKKLGLGSLSALVDQDTSDQIVREMEAAINQKFVSIISFDLSMIGRTVANQTVDLCSEENLKERDGIVVLGTKTEEFISATNFVWRLAKRIPVIPSTPKLPNRNSWTETIGGESQTAISIFNYLETYYLIKYPVEVFYELTSDDGTCIADTTWLGPGAHKTIRTDEIAPAGFKRGAFKCIVYHPKLLQTPNRFRVTTDIWTKRSVDSIHGLELNRGHSNRNEILWRMGKNSDILFRPTLKRGFWDDENSWRDLGHVSQPRDSATVTVSLRPLGKHQPTATKSVTLSPDAPDRFLSAAELFPDEMSQDERDWVYLAFDGEGLGPAADWVCTSDREDGGDTIAFNHGYSRLVTRPFTAEENPIGYDVKPAQLPIPISSFTYGLRVGLALLDVDPVQSYQQLELTGYDSAGQKVDCVSADYNFGETTILDVLDSFGSSADLLSGGLVILRVDGKEWCNATPLLFVETTSSGDIAFTELQGQSLVNVPFYIGKRTGTYITQNSIKSRTHVMSRVVENDRCQTLCTLINSSAMPEHCRSTSCKIFLHNGEGEQIIGKIELPPMTQRTVQISEIFEDFHEHCPDGLGWIRVVSQDAQLRGYTMLRRTDSDAVSIQHMWGA